MKKVLFIIPLLLAVLVTEAVFAFTNQALYLHYLPITITSNSATAYTNLRIPMVISGSGLASQGYIQADGDDLVFADGDTAKNLSVGAVGSSETIMLGQIDIPAYANVQPYLHMNYTAAGARSQPLLTSSDDYSIIPDAAGFDITTNLTISVNATINAIPTGTTKHYLVQKSGAYEVYLTNTNQLVFLLGVPDADFQPSTSDGYVQKTVGGLYSAVHNAATADVVSTAGATAVIGNANLGGGWEIDRAAFKFDTSSLSDNATINSAILKLYGSADNSAVDFNITVVSASGLADPLVAGSYATINGSTTSWGSLNTSGFNAAGWNNITLNSLGITNISLTGTSYYAVRSSSDISATDPGGDSRITVKTSETGVAGEKPKLTVGSSIPLTYTGISTGNQLITATYDGSNMKIYINGAEVASLALVTTINTNSSNILWGQFAGQLYEAKIGSTTLENPTWQTDLDCQTSQFTKTQDAYYVSNDDTEFPAYAGTYAGMNFLATQNIYLDRIGVKLYRVGNPGTVNCTIWNTVGLLPTTVRTYGSLEEESIPTADSGTWVYFGMNKSGPTLLSAGSYYAIVISAQGGNSSNYIYWRADATSPTDSGNRVYSANYGVAWSSNATVDQLYTVLQDQINDQSALGTGDAYIALHMGLPDNISMTYGAVTSKASTTAASTTTTAPTVVSSPTAPDGLFQKGDVPLSATFLQLMYPGVNSTASSLGMNINIMWVTLAIGLAIAAGFSALMFTGSSLIGILTFAIFLGGGYSAGVVPGMILIVCLITMLLGLYAARLT